MKKILVISGPSGVGKSYFAKQLLKLYPHEFVEAKLYTTRVPRKGEHSADRIFVELSDFKKMESSGEFIITGLFHDNWYGYTHQMLKPESAHIIVNAWPALLEKFLPLDNVVIAGLSVSSRNVAMLENRMRSRGDTEQKITERIPLIKKDSLDLANSASKLRKQDRIFIIEDDRTLNKLVLPWVQDTFSL